MNVKSPADLQSAVFMKELIELGAGPKDLLYFNPDYFFSDEKISMTAVRIKSSRVFSDLSSSDDSAQTKRYRNIQSIYKDSTKQRSFSNFFKLCVLSATKKENKDTDLSKTFIQTFKSAMNLGFAGKEDNQISFQDGFTIFRHVAFESVMSDFPLLVRCDSCEKLFPNKNTIHRSRNKGVCPYCNKGGKETKEKHQPK